MINEATIRRRNVALRRWLMLQLWNDPLFDRAYSHQRAMARVHWFPMRWRNVINPFWFVPDGRRSEPLNWTEEPEPENYALVGALVRGGYLHSGVRRWSRPSQASETPIDPANILAMYQRQWEAVVKNRTLGQLMGWGEE